MNLDVLSVFKKGLKETFRMCDSDKSGFIERHQLGLILRKLTEAFHAEDPSEDDVNDILKELDDNGDGKISQQQFEKLIDEVAKIIEEQKANSQ